jgi:hypothetical protein
MTDGKETQLPTIIQILIIFSIPPPMPCSAYPFLDKQLHAPCFFAFAKKQGIFSFFSKKKEF